MPFLLFLLLTAKLLNNMWYYDLIIDVECMLKVSVDKAWVTGHQRGAGDPPAVREQGALLSRPVTSLLCVMSSRLMLRLTGLPSRWIYSQPGHAESCVLSFFRTIRRDTGVNCVCVSVVFLQGNSTCRRGSPLNVCRNRPGTKPLGGIAWVIKDMCLSCRRPPTRSAGSTWFVLSWTPGVSSDMKTVATQWRKWRHVSHKTAQSFTLYLWCKHSEKADVQRVKCTQVSMHMCKSTIFSYNIH